MRSLRQRSPFAPFPRCVFRASARGCASPTRRRHYGRATGKPSECQRLLQYIASEQMSQIMVSDSRGFNYLTGICDRQFAILHPTKLFILGSPAAIEAKACGGQGSWGVGRSASNSWPAAPLRCETVSKLLVKSASAHVAARASDKRQPLNAKNRRSRHTSVVYRCILTLSVGVSSTGGGRLGFSPSLRL
jgi:hypothetical protein